MAGADFDSIGRPREFSFNTTESFILTVPTDRLYEIFAIAFKWTCTATAGTRLIAPRISGRDGNELFLRQSNLALTANDVVRFVWAPGMPDEDDVNASGQMLLQPMPLLSIEEGGEVSLEDLATIDSADGLVGSISARIYKAE